MSHVSHTTLTAGEIARIVEANYELPGVAGGNLARRGFNDVYELQLAGGKRCIVRLSAQRPRGPANAEYESALLRHLKKAGVAVGTALLTHKGAASVPVMLPEGARTLMAFEYLEGDPPLDNLDDIAAVGAGLAQIHEASASYSGPPSLYTLELDHLLRRPLKRLLASPTMDARLQKDFSAIAQRLDERITAMPALSRVGCHGDCHGYNSFMFTAPGGKRTASFFDFDDAGPGYLAYDLVVYLWANLPREFKAQPDAAVREKWARYLAGYRSVRPIPEADAAAVVPFAAVRSFWAMGESAGRIPHWGSQAQPQYWLRKQVDTLTAWETLQI